jgi:hypothetical protein
VTPVTIEDMHGDVAPLNLSDSVPSDIRQQFDIVRNAYIYSWFDYEMITLAEMHAYTVLEMAIRKRAKDESSGLNPKATMQKAINHARTNGWLRDEDFGYVNAGAAPLPVLDLIVMIRNDLMHGKPHLYPAGSLTGLETCFDAIQTLFPQMTKPDLT